MCGNKTVALSYTVEMKLINKYIKKNNNKKNCGDSNMRYWTVRHINIFIRVSSIEHNAEAKIPKKTFLQFKLLFMLQKTTNVRTCCTQHNENNEND